MKKLSLIFLTIFIFSLSYSKKNVYTSEDYSELLKTTNNQVIELIKNKNVKNLSEHIHPKKGVLFSPYSYIPYEGNVILTKKNIAKTYDENEKLTWGVYDGTGEKIFLTFDEYYDKFIYNADFINSVPNYDSIMGIGNSIENTNKYFPNTKTVEYYVYGTKKYSELDWKSLRLVYEEYKGKYYLVAIIHNQWTI